MEENSVVSLEIAAIFPRKVNNNTPVHIVDCRCFGRRFCRGVLGGLYSK